MKRKGIRSSKAGSAFVDAILLPGENPGEFHDFCDQIFLEYRPCGPSEEVCVLWIAKLRWRKSRTREAEEKPWDGRLRPEDDSLYQAMLAFRKTQCHPSKLVDETPEAKIEEDMTAKPETQEVRKRALDLGKMTGENEAFAALNRELCRAQEQLAELKLMKRKAGLVG